MTDKKFSELLKESRARLGLTQKAIATMLSTDRYRVSLRTYQHWEQGRGPEETVKALIINLLQRIEVEQQKH